MYVRACQRVSRPIYRHRQASYTTSNRIPVCTRYDTRSPTEIEEYAGYGQGSSDMSIIYVA